MTCADVGGFTPGNVLFTAIGAAVYWAKAGRTNLRPYLLPAVIAVLGVRGRWRSFIEFMVFIIIGCVVGIGVVEPRNATQGLTAGFAWTGFFAYPEKAIGQ